MDEDRTTRDIMKGQLALALVSARAQHCPRKECGRMRRCLGRLVTNFHAPMGDCPNMSAAEWQAVSLGIQRNLLRLKPGMEARRAGAAGLARAAPAGRGRRRGFAAGGAGREAQPRSALRLGAFYGDLLWFDEGADGLTLPRDVGAIGRRFVAWMGEGGCVCARGDLRGECGCAALGSFETPLRGSSG